MRRRGFRSRHSLTRDGPDRALPRDYFSNAADRLKLARGIQPIMRKQYRVRHRFAETPLSLTRVERAALIARVREAIDREHDSARLRRLERFLARLRDERMPAPFNAD